MDVSVQDAMTTVPPEALSGVARLLLAHEAAAAGEAGVPPAQYVEAAERVLRRLQQQLVRWFGSDGADALLIRALDRTRSAYAVLSVVQRDTIVDGRLTGVAEAAATAVPGALVDACAALIGTVLTLVGRLVGNDLAAHLVEHGWPDLARGESSSHPEKVGA